MARIRSFSLCSAFCLAALILSMHPVSEAGEPGEKVAGDSSGKAFLEVFGPGVDLDDSGTYHEVVTGKQRDPVSDQVCKRFNPSVDDLRSFFLNSKIIEGYTYSSDFPAYGCWYEGVLSISSKEYRWRVTPAAIGFLTDPEGAMTYLACGRDCIEIFPDS